MSTIVSAQPVASPADASPPAKKHKRRAAAEHHESAVDEQLKAMQDKLAAQQAQIDQLSQQLQQKSSDLQSAQQSAAAAQQAAQAAQTAANEAQSASNSNTSAVNSLQGSVADIKSQQATVMTQTTELKKEVMAPVALHYKGVTLTPGGFFAGESVWRQRAIGGDINTQFTGIPYSGISTGQTSEFNLSGRQSRLSLLAEGKADNGWTYRGYVETDFLSAGVTSNSNESNSYTMRVRQAFGQAQSSGGWYFTGGQQWTLMTENKIGAGITNRSEALPMTIDPQYNVGFVWDRQPAIRVVKNFGNGLWAGISAEQAQTLNVGCHNNSASTVSTTTGVATDPYAPCTQLFYQQAGNTGGLYNSLANYSYNKVPDFIAKAAFDSKMAHFELEGLLRTFRDRYFPNDLNPTATNPTPTGLADGAFNQTNLGGGIGASARFDFAKKLDVGFKALVGAGVQRYGTSTLADVTVKPNGSLEPLRGGSMLATVEAHPSPRFDLYANFGVDYAQRVVYTDPGGFVYGYGVPDQKTTGCQTEVPPTASGNGGGQVPGATGSCTADNRAIGEGTLGYWYRFYKGPAGTLQQGMQFSYVERATWQGTGGSPKATDAMWFTSLRYYLP